MKEKILAAIKAKFPTAKLSAKRLDALAASVEAKAGTDETIIDSTLDALNEIYPMTEIAADDHIRSTLEGKLKASQKGTPPKTPEELAAEEEAKRKTEGDMPDWFKTYKEETDRKLSAFENEKKQGSIKSTLSSKLKDIPTAFYENWQLPDSEDKVDEFVTKAQASFDAVKQSFTEKGLAWTPGGGTGGNNNKEATKEEVKGMVDKIMPK